MPDPEHLHYVVHLIFLFVIFFEQLNSIKKSFLHMNGKLLTVLCQKGTYLSSFFFLKLLHFLMIKAIYTNDKNA